MTSLPIPFVVALLLALLAATNHHQMKVSATGRTFALALYLYIMSMLLIGVRWTWDMVVLMPIVATLAIITSALLYLAFRSLGREGPVIAFSRDWLHIVPVVMAAISTLLLPHWLDAYVIASKLLYGGLLILLARKTPDSLQLVQLSWLKNTQHALWGAAILLLVSISVDIAIAIDFALHDGRHAASLVSLVNLVILMPLAWFLVLAGRGMASDTAAHSDNNSVTLNNDFKQAEQKEPSDSEDAALLEKLNKLLIEDQMYADTELNLLRLARKAGVPSRAISRCINAKTGQNVSQWVNKARINAVCVLLKDESVSVSNAMLDAGFVTKSNFNREFRRIKGCSPSQWRDTKL